MDALEIGSFLSELRKQKELKQKEVAEALQVSDKAISRWETGRGIPDVDSLQRLSDFYEVSINEILAGRRIEKNEIEKTADDNLKEAVKRQFFMKRKLSKAKVVVILLLILLAAIPILLLTTTYKVVSFSNVFCVSGDNGMEALEEAFQIVDKLQEEDIDYVVSMRTEQGVQWIDITVILPGRVQFGFDNAEFNRMNGVQTMEYLKNLGDDHVDSAIESLKEIGFIK